MNTFRGAAHQLCAEALDAGQIRSSAILYLEAYLWRSEGPRSAMKQAMAIAHEAKRKVAFTLSDIACIAPHRADFIDMIESGASQAGDAIFHRIARGQQQYRQFITALAHAHQQLHTVLVGQPKVQHHRVAMGRLSREFGVRDALHAIGCHSKSPKTGDYAPGDQFVVLNDQDPH